MVSQAVSITAFQPFMKYYLHTTRETENFKYGIQINDMLDFHKARRWCSDTYGFSACVTTDDGVAHDHWAYYIVYQQYTMYFKGDEELSWFKMRWGSEQ